MKQFIAFVKKEFFHIFRDRRTMLILLGMPVVQIILFGFAITTEVKNVRVGVLDPSNDIVTRKIIDRLDASEYFSVKCLLHSPQEMERAFQENEIDMALVFSEQFADRLYTGCPCATGFRCNGSEYGYHTSRLCHRSDCCCPAGNASSRNVSAFCRTQCEIAL